MTTAQLTKTQKGFTLIELLVVIGILAILLAIVLIAINPARQFAQANDTKRSSDVQTLLNAIHQYAADNAGNLPYGITAGMGQTIINRSNLTQQFCLDLVNKYVAGLPRDPRINNGANITESDCSAVNWDTGYTVEISTNNNRTTIVAPLKQISASISATR